MKKEHLKKVAAKFGITQKTLAKCVENAEKLARYYKNNMGYSMGQLFTVYIHRPKTLKKPYMSYPLASSDTRENYAKSCT